MSWRGPSKGALPNLWCWALVWTRLHIAIRTLHCAFLKWTSPATQAWKRERLAEARIEIPASLTFAPVDFEKQMVADGLHSVGFDREKITFFSWLGVIMYLTRDAALSTLTFIASTPAGGGVVFDYAVPRASLNLMQRLAFDGLTRRVEAAGEPFQLFFDPPEIAAALRPLGFRTMEDLGSEEVNARYFAGRSDGLRVGAGLGRLMSAGIYDRNCLML